MSQSAVVDMFNDSANVSDVAVSSVETQSKPHYINRMEEAIQRAAAHFKEHGRAKNDNSQVTVSGATQEQITAISVGYSPFLKAEASV